jgi:hypothetical protein
MSRSLGCHSWSTTSANSGKPGGSSTRPLQIPNHLYCHDSNKSIVLPTLPKAFPAEFPAYINPNQRRGDLLEPGARCLGSPHQLKNYYLQKATASQSERKHHPSIVAIFFRRCRGFWGIWGVARGCVFLWEWSGLARVEESWEGERAEGGVTNGGAFLLVNWFT